MHQVLRRWTMLVLVGLLTVPVSAQEPAADAGSLDGTALSPVTLEYDTNVKMGQQSTTRPTVRNITEATHDGQSVWRVIDAVQRATQADTLLLDRATLWPLQRRVGGQMALQLTFDSTSVSGSLRSGGQARTMEQTIDHPVLASTANMEVGLATLPLQSGYEAQFPVFDLRRQKASPATIRVTGTETVTVPAGSFETFVLETSSRGGGPSGTYHVRRAAPHHVVKANLEVAGPRGRTVTAVKKLTSIRETAVSGER